MNNLFDLSALQKKWDSVSVENRNQAKTIATTIGGVLMRLGLILAIGFGFIIYFMFTVITMGTKGKR